MLVEKLVTCTNRNAVSFLRIQACFTLLIQLGFISLSQRSDEVDGDDNTPDDDRALTMAEELQKQLDIYLQSADETLSTIQK